MIDAVEDVSRGSIPGVENTLATSPDLAQAIESGIRAGKLDIMTRLINKRFGSVSPQLHERLSTLTSEQLYELAEQFPDVSSAAELETWIDEL
jgi:hypothetical protein